MQITAIFVRPMMLVNSDYKTAIAEEVLSIVCDLQLRTVFVTHSQKYSTPRNSVRLLSGVNQLQFSYSVYKQYRSIQLSTINHSDKRVLDSVLIRRIITRQ